MHYTLNKMLIDIYIQLISVFIQILMHTLQTPACPCTHSHIQQLLTHPSPLSATLPHSPIHPLFTDLLNLHSNKRDKGSWTAFSLSPLLKGNKHTYKTTARHSTDTGPKYMYRSVPLYHCIFFFIISAISKSPFLII